MKKNISVQSAQELILKDVHSLKSQKVILFSSYNRILAENIYSKLNIPPFDNSAMDGYAVKFIDTVNASYDTPVILNIIDSVTCGSVSKKMIMNKEAIKIATGAKIPKGADSVVRVEDTKEENGKVKVFKKVECGKDIRRLGEDIKNGELTLKKGIKVTAPVLGILASLGIKKVSVFKQLKVGVISTGDELLEPSETLKAGKIYNSNAYSLYGQIINSGALPFYFGIVGDNISSILKKFKFALNQVDVLISTGGVSVGEYDIVKDVLLTLGKINIWKVLMRPGHPLCFGKIDKKFIFCLPGNPVSSMVSFEQFVRPLILKIQGSNEIFRPEIFATLEESLEKKKGFVYFIRGNLIHKDGKLFVKKTGPQGSGILKSMLLADGLIVLPEDLEKVNKGEFVKFQLLK